MKIPTTFRDSVLSAITRLLADNESYASGPLTLEDSSFVRKLLNTYLEHSGTILLAKSHVLKGILFYHRVGGVDWIPDYLFRSSESWVVDDFSSLDICLIGTVAHVDSVFRDRLKRELASYRSLDSTVRTHFVDDLFETTFGTASIESHFRTLPQDQIYEFLSLLCRTGSLSMIKLFIDFEIDVNGGDSEDNLLGNAAATGNMEAFRMLIAAGANTALAIRSFLAYSQPLSDSLFRHLLEHLVENAESTPLLCNGDPLLTILKDDRASCLHAKAAEILFDRGLFLDERLGQADHPRILLYFSYMHQAVSNRNPVLVSLLLQNGVHADEQISDRFECREDKLESSCTWLTFSIMFGAASCTNVLIQHGADVTALDRAGRSALQLARMNVSASHPRDSPDYHIRVITAEEDTETLAVVERAFNAKFQGTKSIEDYIWCNEERALQPPRYLERPVSILQKKMDKALRVFLNPTQIELPNHRLIDLYLDIKGIWSLSFAEALLMRSLYVLSYALLLAYEILAFIKGHKRIPTPSRSLLSAVALLLLAIGWGSSQMGFSWGPIAAQPNV